MWRHRSGYSASQSAATKTRSLNERQACGVEVKWIPSQSVGCHLEMITTASGWGRQAAASAVGGHNNLRRERVDDCVREETVDARQGVQLRDDEGLLQKLRRPGSTVAGATADNQPKSAGGWWRRTVEKAMQKRSRSQGPRTKSENHGGRAKPKPGTSGRKTRQANQTDLVCDLTG